LLERLQAILQKRCCGTRLVECTLEEETGHAQRFECSLSRAAQTATYLRPLLHVRLEQLRLQAPVRAMRVRALVLERMPHEQRDLFEMDGSDGVVLPQLLDSLVARLGRDAVSKARFVADPQPELACRFECALEDDVDGDLRSGERRGQETRAEREETRAERVDVFAHRPSRLFARPISIDVMALVPDGKPVRFQHAGVDEVVAHCQGPERIETGWWRGDDVRRDYYVVETKHGTRWWLFRRVDDGRWFLHGCFD
jgi:protein ImuB